MKRTKSEQAVATVLRRIQDDPKIAWLVGPGSQTYEELTDAYADMTGQNPEAFRKEFESTLKFEEWPRT